MLLHVTNLSQLNMKIFFMISFTVKLTASGLRSPLHDHTQDAATPLSTVQLKSSLTKKSSVKPRQPESVSGEAIVHDDLDEAFSNLTGLSMVTLYNCIDLISSSEESREHFLKAGAMQIVWCRLLTAKASTLQQIALPTEMLLNTCCCMSMLEKYYSGMSCQHFSTVSSGHVSAFSPCYAFEKFYSIQSKMCNSIGERIYIYMYIYIYIYI